jgi:outer membrane protein
VNRRFIQMPVLALSVMMAANAQAPTKVGIINIQSAIIGTSDGQKAVKELEAKSAPKRKELEGKQGNIQALQTKLRSSSNTASEEVRNGLARQIDTATKSYNRDLEDAQAEFDQEQQKILGEIGGKMMAVIDKYSTDNGFAVILDVSSQQTPVLFAATSVDITRDIIALYDKNAPASAAPLGIKPMAPTGVKPTGPATSPVKRAPGAPK